jgi:hypothetical protein
MKRGNKFMINYKEVKIIYDAPPFPPKDIKMDTIYSIIKKDNDFYIKSNEIEIPLEIELIKWLFVPIDNIKWEDVSFNDEIKSVKIEDNKINVNKVKK